MMSKPNYPASLGATSPKSSAPTPTAPSKKPSAPLVTVSSPADRDETAESASETQHVEKALKALTTALGLISNLKRAISCIKDPFKVARSSQREIHVQNILLLQRRRVPTINVAFARERIVLIAACISLARDFTDFERRCGWQTKMDTLVARITQGKDTAVQTIGKHLNNYIAHQALSPRPPALSLSRRNLDAAVRFGIKLIVCESLSASMGLPSGLSLLMGFECVSFSRLSYATLGYLRQCIEDEAVRAQVIDFGETVGGWWEHCQDRYHDRFGAEGTARRRSSSLSSAELPMTPRDPVGPMTEQDVGKDYSRIAPFPSSMSGLTSAFMTQPGIFPINNPYALGQNQMMSQYAVDSTNPDLSASCWPQISDAPDEFLHYSWSPEPTTTYQSNISPELTGSSPNYDFGDEHRNVPASSYTMPQATLAPEHLFPVAPDSHLDEPDWGTASWGNVY